MYISYSGYKKYRDCPLAYWHQYIGNTKPPRLDNRVNSLYGSAVGKLFELFYNNVIWRRPKIRDVLVAMVPDVVDGLIAEESTKGVVNWQDPKANYGSREHLLSDVLKGVNQGLDIIKQHQLIGPEAAAEVKLDSKVEGHLFGGRADFVIRRMAPHRDLIILDGKGSKHRGKYVDSTQLRWYALLHKLRKGVVPDRLGFMYWRQKPDRGIDWIPFMESSLEDLRMEVLAALAEIEGRQAVMAANVSRAAHTVFEPAPDVGHCKFCTYLDICPSGQAEVPSAAVKLSGVGVEDISLDDILP